MPFPQTKSIGDTHTHAADGREGHAAINAGDGEELIKLGGERHGKRERKKNEEGEKIDFCRYEIARLCKNGRGMLSCERERLE